MAVIEFSAGLMSSLPQRIVYPSTANVYTDQGLGNVPTFYYYSIPLMPYNFGGPGNSSNSWQSAIRIYQGTVPTDFSTLTLFTSRAADSLITFNNQLTAIFANTVNVSVNPVVINSAFVAASASGTATWFRLMVGVGTNYSDYQNQIAHQIIGTVGATGSGADLELPSTSIVSGQNYRIQNLRIQFPSSWTYT